MLDWLSRLLGGDVSDDLADAGHRLKVRNVDVASGPTPSAQTVEELRIVKRRLLTRLVDGPSHNGRHDPRVAAITSSVRGEGKTFLAAHLAASLGYDRGLTTTLIDASAANPSLATRVAPDFGLLQCIENGRFDERALLSTNFPNVRVLPLGRSRYDAHELLSNDAFWQVVGDLLSRTPSQIVLIDCAAVLAGSDALNPVSRAGQVLFTVAFNVTPRNDIDDALTVLDRNTGPIDENRFSLVLNKTTRARSFVRSAR